MTKKNDKNVNVEYGYYSKLLKEPFDSLNELTMAEEAYYAKQKAKEDAAAQKKADALKVEDAFKALNAARKVYKEDLTQLTKEYAESLDNLKKAFELGKKDIHNQLAEAEEAYQAALKEFADKHPEGYHLTLKDGDFETTIGKQTSENTPVKKPVDLFDLFFGW
jgi:chromosome segregation ATPase